MRVCGLFNQRDFFPPVRLSTTAHEYYIYKSLPFRIIKWENNSTKTKTKTKHLISSREILYTLLYWLSLSILFFRKLGELLFLKGKIVSIGMRDRRSGRLCYFLSSYQKVFCIYSDTGNVDDDNNFKSKEREKHNAAHKVFYRLTKRSCAGSRSRTVPIVIYYIHTLVCVDVASGRFTWRRNRSSSRAISHDIYPLFCFVFFLFFEKRKYQVVVDKKETLGLGKTETRDAKQKC